MFFELQKKIKISRTAAVLYCIVLLIGFLFALSEVYVNCFNSMNAEQITAFGAVKKAAESFILWFENLL